ncbi:PAS domain-containing sensor histidine kinase [Pseudoponticoccus marisrubri]|uniref:histidine kinase n=1 Tax=Pseudoponticoccus marisrubri TaxID=1685382 RepID=A0A0W7WIL7_9RHOB|nr:PAS domain-containing sensor histidine kinase [Pseudoponticoccus marisrubri]KUF10383.1 hypothetical protein AVJ23_13375 [Pseudoponticoccus marisrubri]
MTRSNLKKFTSVSVFALVAVQVAAMIDQRGEWHVLGDLLPWISASAALGMVLLWLSFRRMAARHRSVWTEHLKLGKAVEALHAHGMVVQTDSQGRITFANERFLEATGYCADELVSQPVEMLYFPEDLWVQDELLATIGKGETWTGDTRLRRRDGGEVWTNVTLLPGVDDEGRRSGAISVRTDITESRKKLIDREVFQTLDCIVDQVFIFDLDSLEVKYANQSARAAHGLTDSLAGYGPLGAIHALYTGPEFTGMLDNLRDGGQKLAHCDLVRDGTHFEARLQILDAEDGTRKVLASLRDISLRVEAQHQRDEFISTVSHELRSPMTSVKGAMGLLLAGAGGEPTAQTRNILEIAHRNADRLVSLIDDLLDIEKIASGNMTFNMERHDIGALIDEAIEANGPFSRRFDVTIERDGAEGGQVFIDFDRSLQVLNNLLSNAAKFSPAGGKVIVACRELPEAFEVSVTDHGTGIPAEMVPKVFDKYAQVGAQRDGPVRGTGLGLAIVKAIAEEQGGCVALDSAEGEGSTFYVTFPKPAAGDPGPVEERQEKAS